MLMAFTDLRAGADPTAGSLDASEERGGALSSVFGAQAVQELYRLRERKSAVASLDLDAFLTESLGRLSHSRFDPPP